MPSVDREYQLVLASNSSRRREILRLLGRPFRIIRPNGREETLALGNPNQVAEALAFAKAKEVASKAPNSVVVAADTLVTLEGEILGKPTDSKEAKESLLKLRGRTHEVVTGLAIIDTRNWLSKTTSQNSMVTMRQYSSSEIDAYIASGAPMDKAGAYGVQDMPFKPARWVDGCFLNVVGLPLCNLIRSFQDIGVEVVPKAKEVEPERCDICTQWRERVGL